MERGCPHEGRRRRRGGRAPSRFRDWWWMRKWGDKKREPAEAAGLWAAEFLHSRDELQVAKSATGNVKPPLFLPFTCAPSETEMRGPVRSPVTTAPGPSSIEAR